MDRATTPMAEAWGILATAPRHPSNCWNSLLSVLLAGVFKVVGRREESMTEEEAMRRYLSEQDRDRPEMVRAVKKIYPMSIAERMALAVEGGFEERAVLIRDPSGTVAHAVLRNPSITQMEVEAFSGIGNVSSDMLRAIGSHREWTKSQAVVYNLVKNPRTPIGLALTHLPRVKLRDMKMLSVDRNVPAAVRKQAQKFLRRTSTSEAEEDGKTDDAKNQK